jgi:NTF2 fold immunity protein
MSSTASEAPDYSMLSRRWNGQRLISADLAAQFARLVHKEQYGQSVLDEDEPLSVKEDGDCWIVKGSKPLKYDTNNPKLDGSA